MLNETFEVGQGTTSAQLNTYVGVGGQRYTADPYWLTNCNGIILSGASTSTSTTGNDCPAGPYGNLRTLATSLGNVNGTSPKTANHALTAYTEQANPTSTLQLQTVGTRPFATSNRFVAFRLNYAAINCMAAGAQSPVLQFAYVDQAGTATRVRTWSPGASR